ncbi:MAG: TonB-dependent receptor [Vicinamibacteria bacterium]|nr:TonB-dependent receptor [Vicinamibacteria bacterium]
MKISFSVCRAVGLISLGLVASTFASDEIKAGSITGVVTAQMTQQPIPGAVVRVDGATLSAVSDDSGRFRIENVPVGSRRLSITREGYHPAVVSDIVVTANRETHAVLRLREAVHLKDEVTVRASYFTRPEGVTTGAFTMSYEEVRRAPGAVGDVGRMIQSLPSTIVRDDSRNDIVARGGSPSENLILVDNIEVPNISHYAGQGATGGPITMLNAETISDVSFLAGGFPAAYGDRLSSVLEISLREGNRDRVQTEIDLSMSGAGMLVEGPLGRRGSWLVTGRRSFIDLIAGAWDLNTVPQYANYQAKAVYDVSPRNRLTFISLGGWDKIDFDVDESDLEDSNTFIVEDVGWRGVAGLDWQALLGGSGVLNVSVGHTENDFKVDVWDTLLDDRLVERNRSRERQTTARYDLTCRVGRLGSVRSGAFGKRLGASYEFSMPIGQENVFSTDPQRINTLALDDQFTTWQTGGYIELRPRFGAWATAALGGRFDRYDINDASEVSPRAGLTFHVLHNLDVSASYGRYYQNPPLIFMKAHPDNARLRPIRADHYVTGLAYHPRPDTEIKVEAYEKRYFRYPVSTQFPSITGADTGEQVNVYYYMIPYVGEGRGRSSGVEIYLQRKLSGRIWGQLSYAHSRTENRALDGIWRPSTFDLPHVVSVVAGVKASRSLELSTKFTYTSGRPVMPLLPESYEQNRLIFDLDRVNAERAPAYHRLDFRVDRRQSHRWGNLVFYVELDNVYNRKNILGYGWNPKKRERDEYTQLSFMAIGGVNVEF